MTNLKIINHKKRPLLLNLLAHILLVALPLYSLLICAQAMEGTNWKSDVAYYLPKNEFTMLSLSNNDTTIDIPVFKRPAKQAIVKGLVIIIDDIHSHGHATQATTTLAQELPNWGWNTLVVSPQQHYFATTALINNTTNNDATNDATNENSIDATSTQAPQVLSQTNKLEQQTGISPNSQQDSALAYLPIDYASFLQSLLSLINNEFGQQLGYTVVYAKGQSASSFISLLSNDSLKNSINIDGLVINNAYWPSTETNNKLPNDLATLPMPVLDLTSFADNQWAKQTRKDRAVAVKVNLKPLYRQREIIGTQLGVEPTDYIVREVRAWTTYLGW